MLVPGPRQTVLVCKWRGSNEKALRPAGKTGPWDVCCVCVCPCVCVCVCLQCNVHVHQMNNKRRWVKQGPGLWRSERCFCLRCQSCDCLASDRNGAQKNPFGQRAQQTRTGGLKRQRRCLYVARFNSSLFKGKLFRLSKKDLCFNASRTGFIKSAATFCHR